MVPSSGPSAAPPQSPASRAHPAVRPFRNAALTASVAVLLLLMSRWVDQPLARVLAAGVAPWVDDLFDDIGDVGGSGVYVYAALLVYALSLAGLRRGWRCPLHAGFDRLSRYSVLLLGTMAIGGLITLLLKKVVSRARPDELIERGFHGLGVPFAGDPFDSFPSSHTFTAFALAAVINEIAPRWRWPALGLAALVAASRVVNLDHYLSDVTAAAFLALMVAHYLSPYVLSEHYRWMLRLPWHWRRAA